MMYKIVEKIKNVNNKYNISTNMFNEILNFCLYNNINKNLIFNICIIYII